MDAIGDMLAGWARAYAGVRAAVEDISAMPGHAGLSFGFTVRAGGDARRYVVRLAPPGVTRKGNTDVLRQVPVLQALERDGLPVAGVVWHSSDPRWFGTDAYVQHFVDGAPLVRTDHGWQPGDGDPLPFLEAQIRALARIHQLDWRLELAGWEEPRRPEAEIEHWRALQPRMAEPGTQEIAERLAVSLLDAMPDSGRVGLFHGDFHPSNVLFREDGAVGAVVDWEICGIGRQGLDIAWLSMMLDERCWDLPHGRGLQGSMDPGWILERYETALGEEVCDAAWYKAYACYRFGVITGFNLRLHRTGRRPDAHWEEIGPSCGSLLRRGLELLRDPAEF